MESIETDPIDYHNGLDSALLQKRVAVYEAAKSRRPERWSGATRNWQPVRVVHLNPDHKIAEKDEKMKGNVAFKMAA